MNCETNQTEVTAKGKKRKKALLFDSGTKAPPKKGGGRGKPKEIKTSTTVSSQIYSQSSNSGKSFVKQCNLALYWGPSDQYQRRTKDYEQAIQDHEKEFEALEAENNRINPPKYILETQHIFEKFSDLSECLFELYSSRYNKIGDDLLMSFIKNELNRISIIYFSSLDGLQVVVTEGHEDLKKNVKKIKLLTQKYQENYITDLIDASKSSLKAYLYNYLNGYYQEHYMNNTNGADEEENKKQLLSQAYSQNSNVRMSSRLLNKSFQNYHQTNKQFSAVYINNEWSQFSNESEEDTAVGNHAEEVITTCCSELGFKRILINSITMKRTQANLMKFVMEGTQSERINFSKNQEAESQRKTVLVFDDVDSIFPDEAGFSSGVIKCLENSKVPIILTSHKKFDDSDIIFRWNKKSIKVKNIEVAKNDISAMKIKIRLHIIILFECIIDKFVQEFFTRDAWNTETENILDLDILAISEDDLQSDGISSHYTYITWLLKHMNFDIKKILAMIDMYSWEEITASIDLNKATPLILTNRSDLLFRNQLFHTSNPNIKLMTEIFNNVLPDIENLTSVKREECSSTEEESKPENSTQTPTKNINEFSMLEDYQKYIENLSEFCYLSSKQQQYTENIKTRNICDLNLTKMEDVNKTTLGRVLDDFFLDK